MLTIGDKFPSFDLKAVVSTDARTAFTQVDEKTDAGKWKVVFFWPKDFTFVCPTEIAAFGKLNKEFVERDAVVYGVSTDSEFVHLAWRQNHADLRTLPIAMLADLKRELSTALGILDRSEGVCLRATFIVDPEGIIRFVSVTRQGDMTSAEMQRFMNAGNDRKTLPLFIDDTGSLTVTALRARARRMARRHGIGLLIVDYLQLLSGGDRRDGRTQEVSEITRGLKALAKDLNVPVLALSQLSRAVEGRVDKRPMLSDLRESGSIEQDADVVMFVYREEYYAERSDRRGTQAHIDSMGQAEVIIAKQRRGPTATVPLAFDAALTRFRDPVDHTQQAAA